MAFSAFLDTCVLVPSTLRDLLLEIATHQGFRPLWSTGVESELHRVITRLHAEAGKSSEETTASQNPYAPTAPQHECCAPGRTCIRV